MNRSRRSERAVLIVVLRELYSRAACFVFPSLGEGFGLPVLETMACGTPVVTSSMASLPGVEGDAALLVDPRNVSTLAEAISRVLSERNLREDLRAGAQARGAVRPATHGGADVPAPRRGKEGGSP